MKKFLYPALALSALALASCSSEEPMNGNVADGPVTLKVVIPATMQSRSTLGDVIMATANNLQWSVYEVSTDGSTDPVLIYSDQKAAFSANSAATATTETVTLNLGKGKTYQVAFYADNSENTFATYTDGVVSVNYDNGATNDVQEDVFVGTSAVITVGVDVPSTVQLTRPFAQLNWGTNDLDEETVKHWVGNETSALEATATVKGSVYSAYDVLGAKVSGTAIDAVTFQAAKVSDFSAYTETVTFPVPEYDLVAMNYVLVSDDAPSFDCTLAFNDGFQSVEVNAATLKQNFRTNIYGALLTNPTEFNVEIAPAFEKPDNNINLARNLSELANLLSDPDVEDITVPDDTDIDMTGITNPNNDPSYRYHITSNKTLTVNGTLTTNGNRMVIDPGVTMKVKGEGTINIGEKSLGLFQLSEATLEVSDVTINLEGKTDGVAIAPIKNNTINLDNVTIDSNFGTIQTWDWLDEYSGNTITATNSTFISRSNNPDNAGRYTYTFNINGDNEAVLNNCTVIGVQGAVSATGGARITINGGTYATFAPENPAKPGAVYAFYPIYSVNDGVVTVNNGVFYSSNSLGLYADNDANIVLKGGQYNSGFYCLSTKADGNPAQGFVYKDINETVQITDPWGAVRTVTLTKEVVAQ